MYIIAESHMPAQYCTSLHSIAQLQLSALCHTCGMCSTHRCYALSVRAQVALRKHDLGQAAQSVQSAAQTWVDMILNRRWCTECAQRLGQRPDLEHALRSAQSAHSAIATHAACTVQMSHGMTLDLAESKALR